jgi:NAD(P)-dependent dehydrogenase (short-subunit alcohol dehydrogenase family)
MDQLEGRTAVVTGAAGGLGLAMASAFAAEGMSVGIADIDGERAEAAAAGLRRSGRDAAGFAADVADPASVEDLRDRALERFGHVHLLCNNAGVGCRRPIVESSPEDWQWVFSVNVFGPVNGMRAFVPAMSGAPGEHHIVNTSSMSGVRVGVTGHQSIYVGSKFAVVGLSEALRAELEPLGIGLSVLLPGPFTTDMASTSRRARQIQTGEADDEADGTPMAASPVGYLDPAAVGPMVVDAVRRNLPFIVTHPQFWPHVAAQQQRLADAFSDAARREGAS